MDSPERGRSSVKREVEDNSDINSDRGKDDEEWEGDDKRKPRSSKSRKLGSREEGLALDSSGKKRSSGDRNESRKRSSGSSRVGSDEDDYDTKKESHSKQMKKKQEESALEKLSNWYQEGDLENKHDGRSGENVRRKSSSNFSDHERSQSRKKEKDEKLYDGELEKSSDRDTRYNERRESSRGKEHGSSEHTKNSRRRWDESDAARKAEDSTYVEKSDLISGNSPEPNESKSRGLDSNSDKDMTSYTERSKSKGRLEAPQDENKKSSLTLENRSSKEIFDENRQQRNSTGRDVAESRVPLNSDEAGNTRTRDKSRHESEHLEADNERGITRKGKELEKDGYRDDRSKRKDDGWVERNRDREDSEDPWSRGQPKNDDKETKNGEIDYSHGREWELQRHGRERADNERHLGRSGGRKDGSRTEAVKTSSKYGISNENYDVIEIQTKPFNYENGESRSTFSRRNEVGQQSDMKMERNDEARISEMYGSGDDSKDRYVDYGTAIRDQNSWRGDIDTQAGKGRGQKGVQTSSSGSQPPYGNQDPGSFNRAVPFGGKGNRVGRGGRGRPAGRDGPQFGIPVPMMGSPFGPLGMPPPGPMQPLTPGHGPPISPGVFIPPFSPPVVWPGPRGVEMNMLAGPPSLSPVPPGPSGQRFSPNLGTPPNLGLYFNQPDPGRGVPPNTMGPGFNPVVPVERGYPQEKSPGGWVHPKSNGPVGKAPSRGEQNDYSQNFVDTGMRPQNFIRELELTNVVEDYPKLRELIQKKDEIVAKSASPPMYYKCDLKEHALCSEFFGTKFDVILVDPPWEEYVHRAPGVTDHMEYWTLEEIMNLKIEAIADTPSFIFLWVGDGVGLEQGRQCLKKWGFRRCEDICWVKTNKNNATPALRHDSHTLFQHSKEHCLMGIKGTVRRSTDGHVIHANIDTDVIIADEPPYGSTAKPEDMYRIIEHFSLGRRRLELFGEDHNIRSGWLTVGKELSSSNFNAEAYVRNFADSDGKVWQGGGGRNPPPEAPHLVVTTPDIEALRPKSPMKNQQQLQHQQSMSISLTTANSSNKRPAENSPQNHNAFSMNQEASSSNPSAYGF